MTDNEIKKALECCCKGDKKDCFECPLQNSWDCHKELREKALDLINRQQAEIERLTTLCTEQNEELGRLQKVRANILKVMKENISQTKSEAIKEFAERLKEMKLNKQVLRLPLLDLDVDDLVKKIPTAEEVHKMRADYLLANNVLVLPYALGSKVWCLGQPCGGCECFNEPMTEEFIKRCRKCDEWEIGECEFDYELIPEWGELVFPTREQAKEALRKKLEEARKCK